MKSEVLIVSKSETLEDENKEAKTHPKEHDWDLRLFSLQKALQALAHAQEEQERALAASKTEKKTIEKKAEIAKKDKDITIVVDDEDSQDKLKDPFKEGVLAITIDMLGFEKFHLEQYQQQLANYSRFLAEYLEGERLGLGKKGISYTYSDQKQEVRQETTEVQMLTYGETQDYVRSTVMNSILGAAGANYVDPNTKDSWELWRIFQHNQILSFLYTSEWRH